MKENDHVFFLATSLLTKCRLGSMHNELRDARILCRFGLEATLQMGFEDWSSFSLLGCCPNDPYPQFRIAIRFFRFDTIDSFVLYLFSRFRLVSPNVMSVLYLHAIVACAASLAKMMMRSFGASFPIALNISDARWWTGSPFVTLYSLLIAFFGGGDP